MLYKLKYFNLNAFPTPKLGISNVYQSANVMDRQTFTPLKKSSVFQIKISQSFRPRIKNGQSVRSLPAKELKLFPNN